jgi:hypothetical protein
MNLSIIDRLDGMFLPNKRDLLDQKYCNGLTNMKPIDAVHSWMDVWRNGKPTICKGKNRQKPLEGPMPLVGLNVGRKEEEGRQKIYEGNGKGELS